MERSIVPVVAFLVFVSALSSEAASDWPNWRGPRLDGSAEGGPYSVEWNPDSVLWKAAVPGKGCSTPIVWQKKIYLTTGAEGLDTALALDWSGKELWRTPLGKETPGKHKNASGSNPSPVTDGEQVFIFFKSGELAALAMDGTVRWRKNLFKQFGEDKRFWDFGISPVLTKQHVVMAQMHAGDSYLAAFDKETGKLGWKVARNYKTPVEGDQAYATPLVYSREGAETLLVWGGLHLTAHDAANGGTLWSCGGFNPRNRTLWPAVATPVVVDDVAVVCCGRADRKQPRLHGIRMGGDGDVTGTHRLWQRDDIGAFVPSPCQREGRVYVVGDLGAVDCIEPRTGRTLWHADLPKGRGKVFASPLVAAGHLYVARDIGTVYVARIDEAFELVSQIDMGERVIGTPIALDGRLLIRGDSHLFCIAGEQ
jgi:outer membrane protein assembly factor BamB